MASTPAEFRAQFRDRTTLLNMAWGATLASVGYFQKENTADNYTTFPLSAFFVATGVGLWLVLSITYTRYSVKPTRYWLVRLLLGLCYASSIFALANAFYMQYIPEKAVEPLVCTTAGICVLAALAYLCFGDGDGEGGATNVANWFGGCLATIWNGCLATIWNGCLATIWNKVTGFCGDANVESAQAVGAEEPELFRATFSERSNLLAKAWGSTILCLGYLQEHALPGHQKMFHVCRAISACCMIPAFLSWVLLSAAYARFNNKPTNRMWVRVLVGACYGLTLFSLGNAFAMLFVGPVYAKSVLYMVVGLGIFCLGFALHYVYVGDPAPGPAPVPATSLAHRPAHGPVV